MKKERAMKQEMKMRESKSLIKLTMINLSRCRNRQKKDSSWRE